MLQIGDRTIASEEILPLLAGYKMLPQFIEELLIDQAIAAVDASPEELETAKEQFYGQNQITEPEAQQEWLQRYGMTAVQLEALASREFKLEKYKQQTWGHKLESYFLTRKSKLDKVIYSLIRTQDVGIAQELYFRILEGEQGFGELARTYSKGPEAQTEGLIGPVELSVPHPTLGQLLASSQPGEINPPTRVGEWIVLVRLEKFIPAQMDDAMRRRLLNECFDTWLRSQIDNLGSLSLEAPPTADTPLPELTEPPAPMTTESTESTPTESATASMAS
jgi:parvulin-like peptidyl-prolyl isomerase